MGKEPFFYLQWLVHDGLNCYDLLQNLHSIIVYTVSYMKVNSPLVYVLDCN